jgi:hypothetical protein
MITGELRTRTSSSKETLSAGRAGLRATVAPAATKDPRLTYLALLGCSRDLAGAAIEKGARGAGPNDTAIPG